MLQLKVRTLHVIYVHTMCICTCVYTFSHGMTLESIDLVTTYTRLQKVAWVTTQFTVDICICTLVMKGGSKMYVLAVPGFM